MSCEEHRRVAASAFGKEQLCVTFIKFTFYFFIQDLQMYAGVLKISIKFLSYALSLCFRSRSLILYSSSLLSLVVLRRSERMVWRRSILPDGPSCLDRREINETRVLA